VGVVILVKIEKEFRFLIRVQFSSNVVSDAFIRQCYGNNGIREVNLSFTD
jgi:hypothetical protein